MSRRVLNNVTTLHSDDLPPNDTPAEQALLGAYMIDQSILRKSGLKDRDFYKASHQGIYRMLHAMDEKGVPFDPVTVADTIREMGYEDKVGGYTYVLEIAANTPSTANAEHYEDIIKRHSVARQKIDIGNQILDRSRQGKDTYELGRKLAELDNEVRNKARFPLIYAADIDTHEDTDYLIDSYIEERSISLLYAPKDHLKSFVGVDWSMCVASGKPWKGFEVKPGPVVYIAGEGNTGLKRRMKAWCIKHGVDISDLKLALSTMPMQVLDKDDLLQWVEHIRTVTDAFNETPRFLVIDTLATNFGPGEENSPTDMARFLAQLKIYIQAEFNCTILVVHHSGKDKDKGARGGSAIEGNADSVFYIERDGDPEDQRIKLVCKHIKDAERPPPMMLKAAVVELGIQDKSGIDITSLVLDQELSETELAVLNQTNAGRSQREIASSIGKHRTQVARIQKRLKGLNRL
jgi:hypothetical protein